MYLQVIEMIRESLHCALVYTSQLIGGKITENGQI